VGYCERWYEARGQPCLFRLSPLVEPGLEQFLAKRGYDRSDRTLVLHRRARGLDPRRAGLDVRDNGLYDWLRAYAQFTGAPAAPAPMARIIERMGGGALLGTLWGADPRRAVACGLAVVDGALLGLFDLVVAPDYRRRGFGTELVRRLATWGMVGGATDVYLQVTEANVPALGLYGSLGFREAYDYWYRIRCS
jgi:ribosomal protein S18 acetylase RimI-like enzyme